ncbi:FAD binding domain-containing protein [Gordonia sp. ABSL1-1]|uniref:FAD binding domain-containing protein n=1 Tax=Gordonia sp. ABSL1-1 TaxID=3053923 RepID=UPI0025726933|nr:FAD binding domain-containing protein [Gordonia sp. ABSL1-1]MDL9937131.1 FAD binding domain-containing protein [Gordonia sp. ABSL1-1]
MDLHTITGYRFARTRADLTLAPGERILAGGTWLFSEPQPAVTGLVDISSMDWPATEDLADGGLRVAATCTIAELADVTAQPFWQAHPLLNQCAHALLASFKIWRTATVGGNICRSFAAASMVSLAVGLDATAHVWTPDGGTRDLPVAELITGNGTNSLDDGEVLRAIDIPGSALRSQTAFRRIALAEYGRSGTVVTGRLAPDGGVVVGVTAATWRPHVLRYPALPDPATLRADVGSLDDYYTDPLGNADWRRATATEFAEEIRAELATGGSR